MGSVGFDAVKDRIAAACVRAGRGVGDVTLIVVSKQRTDAEVLDVYGRGHRVFAENRQQGLEARWQADLPSDIEWHFIGPLQRRKVPFVATHCDLLHAMDRMSLARSWAERTDTPVLIQFNLGGESQKSGFAPDEADEAMTSLLDLGLDVRGVMAIPPMSDDPDDARPWFARLRQIYDTFADAYPFIDTCSMGMTNDFEVAIEEGATMVRIGRAIFGSAEQATG